jgi:hypothetical protein
VVEGGSAQALAKNARTIAANRSFKGVLLNMAGDRRVIDASFSSWDENSLRD